MLDKASSLKGYRLNSFDGEIGSVREFYFDDLHWTIRYLVADTGNWLADRQVLISPYALDAVSREQHHIAIALTKKQVEGSPSLSSDKPVSRQFEEAYYGYFQWPTYWGGAHPTIVTAPERSMGHVPGEKAGDPHLRSTNEVTGYHIHATDGEIGHVDDFVIDDETWAIRYLVIDTRNWWPGKKVLVSPQWIDRVSWEQSTVFINLSRETIKQAPEYSQEIRLTRDYETGLHRHYNRRGYWVKEPDPAKQPR
jgi:hypothetical protein